MLYRAKADKDEGVKGCKQVGSGDIFGYELVNTFFVDNSGFGGEGIALDFKEFLNKIRAGFYYGITSAGQFQVYIGEFKRISRAKIFKEQEIASSKLISKSCRVINYINGDKTIRLYTTDILQYKGDKIIFNSGGYKTVTTKSRINQFLPAGVYLYQKDYEWYIADNRKKNIEGVTKFFNGIELPRY